MVQLVETLWEGRKLGCKVTESFPLDNRHLVLRSQKVLCSGFGFSNTCPIYSCLTCHLFPPSASAEPWQHTNLTHFITQCWLLLSSAVLQDLRVCMLSRRRRERESNRFPSLWSIVWGRGSRGWGMRGPGRVAQLPAHLIGNTDKD